LKNYFSFGKRLWENMMFVKFGKENSPSFKKIEREAIQENHSDSFIRWVVEGLTL
jgi:hypothetical protein